MEEESQRDSWTSPMHQTNPRIPQFLSFGAEDLSPLSR